MTVTDLKALIADVIDENYRIRNEYGEDPSVENPDEIAALILERIQDTHFIMEKGPTIDHSDRYVSEWSEAVQPNAVNPAAMDAIGKKIAATKAEASWQGQVDRQGGSFSDQEIADSYTWR